MNPVLVFLIIIFAVIIWFFLSFLFKFIGGITAYIYGNAKDVIMEDDYEDDINLLLKRKD